MSLEAAIAGLVARLETVTARLEKIEGQVGSGGGGGGGGGGGAALAASGGEAVNAFDDIVADNFAKYMELSNKIGDDVAKQAAAVQEAINAQRTFLNIASQSKKPAADVLQKLVKPTADAMAKVSEIREKAPRSSKFFNHLSTLSEGIPALGWVLVEPTPGPHVVEATASSEFYGNRVIKDHKGVAGSEHHLEWNKAWNSFLKDLAAYIKKYHTTSVSWNPKGGDASAAAGGSAAPAAKAAGGPPPPMPTAAQLDKSSSSSAASKPPARGALFSELAKGEAVTSGLKKVTADMQTHKNTALRAGGKVEAKEPKPATASKPKAGEKVGTPKCELVGNKWVIEWQIDNKAIVIENPEVKHTVYIYKCKNSVIQIKGKVNSISLDSCSKTALVFTDAIAVCETVNCQSVQIQCTGRVPSFSCDKTDGFAVYVSKDNLDTELVSAKSSEMNVVFPNPKEGEDPIEIPVPEQFSTRIVNNKLVTVPVDHSGG